MTELLLPKMFFLYRLECFEILTDWKKKDIRKFSPIIKDIAFEISLLNRFVFSFRYIVFEVLSK